MGQLSTLIKTTNDNCFVDAVFKLCGDFTTILLIRHTAFFVDFIDGHIFILLLWVLLVEFVHPWSKRKIRFCFKIIWKYLIHLDVPPLVFRTCMPKSILHWRFVVVDGLKTFQHHHRMPFRHFYNRLAVPCSQPILKYKIILVSFLKLKLNNSPQIKVQTCELPNLWQWKRKVTELLSITISLLWYYFVAAPTNQNMIEFLNLTKGTDDCFQPFIDARHHSLRLGVCTNCVNYLFI